MRYSALGPHEFSEQKVVPDFQVVDYTYEDVSSLKVLVPVPAKTFVLAVMHQVTTAFTSGGSQITVGDGDNAANWLGTNDSGATLNFISNSLVAGETNAKGKYYADAGYIKITFNATPTAGAGRLFIMSLPPLDADWRRPAPGDQDYVEPGYPTSRP